MAARHTFVAFNRPRRKRNASWNRAIPRGGLGGNLRENPPRYRQRTVMPRRATPSLAATPRVAGTPGVLSKLTNHSSWISRFDALTKLLEFIGFNGGRFRERHDLLFRGSRIVAVLGFSDIGKVVRWQPELVYEELYEELEDADNLDQPVRQMLQSRVLVIDSATLPPEARLAVAEVSQTANGFRVKMHDKHAALVSIGKHLGMFTDQVQVRARYAISDQPMSAEEWKKQYVKEG
jgi:hypothetical protein